MSLGSRSMSLRSSLLRPFVRQAPRATLPAISQRFAHEGYGSSKGDPQGDQSQPNPSADREHPGPPPPKVGQNTGTTATKGTSEGHNTSQPASSSSGSSKSSEASSEASSGKSSRSEGDSSSKKSSTEGAQPKILSESPPEDPSGDVKKHNEELEHRAERAEMKIDNKDAKKDKVNPKFWSGHGGADREP